MHVNEFIKKNFLENAIHTFFLSFKTMEKAPHTLCFLRHLFLSWLLTDITLPAANFIYLTLVSNYSISRATELPLKKNAVER